jgi:hypothetical protein
MSAVQFRIDSREVDAWLKGLEEPKVAKALRTSTTAGAKAAVPILRAKTPTGKGMTGKYAHAPGNLRALVRHKAMKKRYGIGSVVAPMGKAAYYRRFVELGTKAHVIAGPEGGFLNIGGRYMRAVRHPGARPRHFIGGAAGSMTDAAESAFESRMIRYMESGRQPAE